MTHQEHIFVSTLDDIRERISRGDRYSIIRASGMLRQLLLDENRLVHQVNRNYRFAVKFETSDFRMKPPIRPDIHWKTLDCSSFPNAKKITSNLDQFLQTECLLYKQHEYTVRDVIKACANIMGGVHSGNPKTDKERSLLQLDEVLRFGGVEPSLAALQDIVRVALAALAPLETAIRGSTASTSGEEA